MKLQRLQVKEAYADFTIHRTDIDPSFDALAEASNVPDTWLLGVVNITNTAYSYASISINGGAYGRWFRIPETGKTCETNYDECIANGGWQAILKLPKASSSFNIRIGTVLDERGNSTGLEFLNIAPDANYEGGVIGVA